MEEADSSAAAPVPESRVRDEVLATPEPMPGWIPRAILLFLGGVAGLLILRWMLAELQSLLLILVVSFFLSFALEPAVDRLANRGMRRGAATGLVMDDPAGADLPERVRIGFGHDTGRSRRHVKLAIAAVDARDFHRCELQLTVQDHPGAFQDRLLQVARQFGIISDDHQRIAVAQHQRAFGDDAVRTPVIGQGAGLQDQVVKRDLDMTFGTDHAGIGGIDDPVRRQGGRKAGLRP